MDTDAKQDLDKVSYGKFDKGDRRQDAKQPYKRRTKFQGLIFSESFRAGKCEFFDGI